MLERFRNTWFINNEWVTAAKGGELACVFQMSKHAYVHLSVHVCIAAYIYFLCTRAIRGRGVEATEVQRPHLTLHVPK